MLWRRHVDQIREIENTKSFPIIHDYLQETERERQNQSESTVLDNSVLDADRLLYLMPIPDVPPDNLPSFQPIVHNESECAESPVLRRSQRQRRALIV